MTTNINLGDNIARLRREKGITQDELAAYLGVTKASVSKWETGQSFPDIMQLPRLANYFGISIDGLMGYKPQMSKQVCDQEMKRLRALFAHEGFAAGHEAARELVREYFACPKVLAEVALLYLNHLNNAPDELAFNELVSEAIELCQRVRLLDATVPDLRLAALIEASLRLLSGHPDEALHLLDESWVVEYGEGELLAKVYSAMGAHDKAEQTLQAIAFQSLVSTLNALSSMALSPTCDAARLDELHKRALALIDAFNLDEVHVNAGAIHVTLAMAYAMRGLTDQAIECLERYERVCERLTFPLEIARDDAFFDRLHDWMLSQDVSFAVPRDDDLVKASIVSSVTQNPAFACLADDKRFKRIVKSLTARFG